MKRNVVNTDSNYRWVIYSVCFLMIFVCLGFASTGRAIFLAPVTEALEIPRSVFSVSDSCRFISAALVNAFFGTLVSRFGTKKLILAGVTALILSMVLFAVAQDVFLFYLAGAILGVGFSWTSTTMVGSIVMRWCKKSVGTVMGVILAANGIGSAVVAQVLTPVIYKSKFGYRNAYFIIAACLLVVLLSVLILYREGEKSIPQRKKQPSKGSIWEGIHIKEAVKKPYFYIMAVYVFFMGLVLQGMVGSFAANLKDSGLSEGLVATVVSIYSVSLSLSKILSGAMYDKLGLKITVSICNICVVITLLFMIFTDNSSFGRIIAVVSAITFALALPLETIMLPIFTSDLFGLKSYNDILGVFVSVSYAGMGIGVPLMNLFYDAFGSYNRALYVSVIIMSLCCVVFFIAARQSEKIKNSIKKEEKI